ncbi:TPA: dATP/dGTP pyrophosphohydrolase domain-containing protein [Salmonella enterica subsp. enterica serovar Bovismorbificans]
MTTITKEWLQQTIAEFENTRDDIPFGLDDDDAKILIVLKRALASLERERIRREHAEWSDKTFGDVGPVGPLKHLSKEALEAAADPSDPLEWADMQFLLWDAQRRMGISDEFITRAMIEKLKINKSRQWPEPKDGEPRLHIKEQSAPVIPDGWISCSERMPDEIGRYWCYVEEQNDLGKSHYQWNCSWNGDKWGGEMMSGKVTHWMPLPEPPQEFNRG